MSQRLRQRGHVAAAHQQPVHAVTNHVRHAAGAVRQVRQAVRPCLRQHQAERVGTARQREQVQPREEVAFLLVAQHAQAPHRRPCPRRELLPEAAEIRHLRPREDHAAAHTSPPQERRRPQQIDRPLLLAVVRQMSDHDLLGLGGPGAARPGAVPAGTLGGVHAQPLQDDARGGHAAVEEGVAFALGLHEDHGGGVDQREQGRRSVGAARAVGGVARVAEVQERRQQERHAQPPRQPQAADDRPGVGERRRVNDVEGAVQAAHVAPHRPGDRVAAQRHAAQRPPRQQRQGLEDVAPGGTVPERVTAHLDGAVRLDAGRQTPGAPVPERFEVERRGREDGNAVAATGEVVAEAGKVGFRAAPCRRITLGEMRDANGRPCLSENPPAPTGGLADSTRRRGKSGRSRRLGRFSARVANRRLASPR